MKSSIYKLPVRSHLKAFIVLLLAGWIVLWNPTQAGAQERLTSASSESALPAGQSTAIENQRSINWSGHDYAPRISPDGHYILFQSDRPGQFEDQNLWMSRNQNWPKRHSKAHWSIPQSLSLPLFDNASRTMQLLRPSGSLSDPKGAFSVNTDSFEGMAAYVFRNSQPVEIYLTAPVDSKANRSGYGGLNIYFSRYRDQRWSPLQHLDIINSQFDDKMPYVSRDGRKMYFISNRPGGYGQSDIWYAERNLQTGLWSRPVNAGPRFNSVASEVAPSLGINDDILFFSSNRSGGMGHYDFYMSMYDGLDWQAARNMGRPFNSPRDDEYLSMTHDGLWVYFSSDREVDSAKGGFDIYRARTPDWLLSHNKLLFKGLVRDAKTRLALGVEATIQVLSSHTQRTLRSRVIRKQNPDQSENNFIIELYSKRSYRVLVSAPGYHPTELRLDYQGPVKSGNVDRRVIYLQPVVEESTTEYPEYRTLSGKVQDVLSSQPIAGARIVVRTKASSIPLQYQSDSQGRFILRLPREMAFQVTASARGYESKSMSFLESPDLKEILIKLKPDSTQDPCENLRLDCIAYTRVFFDTDESALRKTEHQKLDRVALILKQFPDVSVELAGHTDHVYTREYNKRLSEARARSVKQYLLGKGIDQKRLKVNGYGFQDPMIKEEKTEKDRQANRRVEFRIITSIKPDSAQ